MPVEFRCHSCAKYLEVDDEHAGGKALCPFCQATNNVPGESPPGVSADQAVGPSAAAVTDAQPGAGEEAPADRQPEWPEQRRAQAPFRHYQEDLRPTRTDLPPPAAETPRNRLAWWGLVLTVAAWGLLLAGNILAAAFLPEVLGEGMRTPAEAEAALRQHPWLMAVAVFVLLAFLLNVIGLSISLAVTFNARARGKGPAVAGVVTGGMLWLCMCGGMMIQFVMAS